MLTTGFKLFFGIAVVSIIGAALYGVASGDLSGKDYLGFVDPGSFIGVLSLGWKGGVGDHAGYVVLVFSAVAAGFVGLSLVGFRDADPEAVARLAGTDDVPPPAGPTADNIWPAFGALAVGVTVMGLVTHAAIFVTGLILLGVAGLEWMMSAWADRATGDPAANRELRSRIMAPFEIPLLGAAAVAVIVLSASRILLTVSELNAVWIAIGASAVITLGAVIIAALDNPSRGAVVGVVAAGVLIVVVLGIVSAAVGQRDFHHEEEEHHEEAALVIEVTP